jgi:hypothetical protein
MELLDYLDPVEVGASRRIFSAERRNTQQEN